MKEVDGPFSPSFPPLHCSQTLTEQQHDDFHDHHQQRRRRRRPSRNEDHFFFNRDLLEQEEIVFERQQEEQRHCNCCPNKQHDDGGGGTCGPSRKANANARLQDNMVVATAAWHKNRQYNGNNSMRNLMDEIMVEYGDGALDGDDDHDDNGHEEEEKDSKDNEQVQRDHYCFFKTVAAATTTGGSSSTTISPLPSPSLNRRHARHERLLQEQYRRRHRQREQEQHVANHTLPFDMLLLHKEHAVKPPAQEEEAEEEEEKKPFSVSSLRQQLQSLPTKHSEASRRHRPFATLERWDEDLDSDDDDDDDDDEFEVANLLRSASSPSRVPSMKTAMTTSSNSDTTFTARTTSTANSGSISRRSSAVSSSGFTDNSGGSSSSGFTSSNSSSGNNNNNSSHDHVKSSPSPPRSSCSTTSSSSSSLYIKSEDDDDNEEEKSEESGKDDNGNNNDDDDYYYYSYHGAYFLEETRKWSAGEAPHYLIQLMDDIWEAGQPLQFKIYRKFDDSMIHQVEEVPHKVLEGEQIIQWIQGWIEYYEWFYTPCSWSITKSWQSHSGFKQTNGRCPPRGEETFGKNHQVAIFDFCIMKSDVTLIHVEHDDLLHYCQEEIDCRKEGFNLLLSRRVAYIGGLSPTSNHHEDFMSKRPMARIIDSPLPAAHSVTIQTTIRPAKQFYQSMMEKQPYSTTSHASRGSSNSSKAIDVLRPYKHHKLEPKKTHRRTQSLVFQFPEF